MELYMGRKWYSTIAVVLALLGSCGFAGDSENDRARQAENAEAGGQMRDAALNPECDSGVTAPEDSSYDAAAAGRALEEIAELERSGGFVRGMGLAESELREKAGDYAGAVAAAYKELAFAYGGGDGSCLKSKFEIEAIISRSLNAGNPEMLAPLMPLISLPDNPYTFYAVGALRALAAVPQHRDYFSGIASGSCGRLAERLAYICRG
jgi:hypothetical protein